MKQFMVKENEAGQRLDKLCLSSLIRSEKLYIIKCCVRKYQLKRKKGRRLGSWYCSG